MNAYTQLPANTSNYTAFESMTTTEEYWQANQTCKMEKNSWWLLAIYYSVTELWMQHCDRKMQKWKKPLHFLPFRSWYGSWQDKFSPRLTYSDDVFSGFAETEKEWY